MSGEASPRLLVELYNAATEAAESRDLASLEQARALVEQLTRTVDEQLKPDADRLLTYCDDLIRDLDAPIAAAPPKPKMNCPACDRELEGSPVRCRFCGELLV